LGWGFAGKLFEALRDFLSAAVLAHGLRDSSSGVATVGVVQYAVDLGAEVGDIDVLLTVGAVHRHHNFASAQRSETAGIALALGYVRDDDRRGTSKQASHDRAVTAMMHHEVTALRHRKARHIAGVKKSSRGPEVVFVQRETGKHLIEVPNRARLSEISGRNRHGPRGKRKVCQSCVGNEPCGSGRWAEHRDLVATIRKGASDGDKASRQAEVVSRQHGEQEPGHQGRPRIALFCPQAG